MVQIDGGLSEMERRFIDGWIEGMGRKLGIPEPELQKFADSKHDDMVAIAHKWKRDLEQVITK
jgi:hypothetical protein